MRLIDADNLIDRAYKERLDSRELIVQMIESEPVIDAVPVEPIEFEWCNSCKEYDQNAHCCHRWTKVIRNTVNDLKTQGYEIVRHGHWEEFVCSVCGKIGWDNEDNYCPNCGAKMDEVKE